MSSIKTVDLVLDFSLYPRNDVSSQHVASLVEALQSGNPLPPIVVERKSLRVVDGFHRVKAYQKTRASSVPVILKDYKTDAELFADAVRLNAAHGRSFDTYDRRRAVVRLIELGFKEKEVAEIVRITTPRVADFLKSTCTAQGGETVVVKSGLRSVLLGRTAPITKKMTELNRTWSGMEPSFHVNQLISLLGSGVLPGGEGFRNGMDMLVELWAESKKKMSKAS